MLSGRLVSSCQISHGVASITAHSRLRVDRVIRFDTAARVAELAEATEAAYGRRTCLHVIDDFDVTADWISELLK